MKTIPITAFEGVRIGQVEDAQAGTGVTVIIAPDGMAAGLDVRGGGPASRDTRILDPLAAAEFIHATGVSPVRPASDEATSICSA
jgi:L-aminopeptidase/D-esterase-like protein